MTSPHPEGISEAVLHFLNHFPQPARLLVAVSGGGDSVGLLVALDEALKTGRFPGFSLFACTVDHALRTGSAGEADFVAHLCARRGIPHATRRWEGPKPATGIQAAARQARHALLAQAAREAGADAILVAHNFNDQRETIAMRRARRDGGAGLAGIAPATLLFGQVWVLRPLLGVSGAVIRTYLRDRGQDWVEDPSNASRRFERVQVRLADVATSGARADEATGQGVAMERCLSSRLAGAFLTREAMVFDASLARLPHAAIVSALGDAAAWSGLLALVAALGGREHRLEAASAERVRAFLRAKTLSRMTAGRVVFDQRREGLFLYRECRGIDAVGVAPFEEAVWDRRWRIINSSDRPLTILAADNAHAPDRDRVPLGVAARAARSRPVVMAAGAPADPAEFALVPVLSPYDRYLPVFDLPLADALAQLFGRQRYPAPPNGPGCDVRLRGESL